MIKKNRREQTGIPEMPETPLNRGTNKIRQY